MSRDVPPKPSTENAPTLSEPVATIALAEINDEQPDFDRRVVAVRGHHLLQRDVRR